MIQVELSKIIIDEKRHDQVIVLKEKEGDRQFPIVIGFTEASSIKMKLSGVTPPRPMTHDLIVNILEAFNAKMERLVIDDMVNNTFHSKLELKLRNGRRKIIDSRPSDGIAVAVRTGAPIFVQDHVLDKAEIFKSH